MGFVTPALLAGGLLVAIPIALHLIMRKQPQQLLFPALRFVKGQRDANRRQLKLRHLLLLVLRCAAIGLLALAIARPYLKAAGSGGQQGPIAAALVCDNSLRMQYVHENRTRLEAAQELGSWLLRQLPAESPVLVVDRRGGMPEFALDHNAAGQQIETLSTATSTVALVDAMETALDRLEAKADHRHEVYVLTDLAKSEFPPDALERLRRRLENNPAATIYFVDVGLERTNNIALGDLQLPREVVTLGGALELATELWRHNTAADVTLELEIADLSGDIVKRRRQLAKAAEQPASPVTFSVPGLTEGHYQGELRMAYDDPLPLDNRRYFTFTVAPPNSVLLLVENPDDTLYLREALCPQYLPDGVQARFECSVVPFAELPRLATEDYDAVIAVDPGRLPAGAYASLADYATRGGGLAIVLGRRSKRNHWSQSSAVGLLPGPLARQSRDESQLEITNADHPLLSGFRDVLGLASWSSFPVYRYWQFADLDSTAHPVVRLANGDPLIVEHQMGQGHVITITTPLAGPGPDNANAVWNLLPVALDAQPWPFFVLANGLAGYLASARDGRLNYLAGEAAVLPLAPSEQVANFALALPGGVIEKRSLAPTLDDIVISDTSAIGHYRVLAGGQQATLKRGFSVNGSSRFSRLTRIDRGELLEALGKDRVKLAETRHEIDISVGQARFGSELFGWLVALLVVVLVAEHLLSNRFYRPNRFYRQTS